jgi:hypothetical protein
MPDIAKIEAVAAKLEPSEGAEPAPETAAAPPVGGPSGAGSAPAESTNKGQADPSSSGATIDHAEIERKLQADRERREEKERRKQARADQEAAKKEREEAAADRKAAAEERARLGKIGKGTPWKEALREMGRDPTEVFREMQTEALKEGTPEAQVAKLQELFAAEMESVRAELKAEKEAREADRKQREDEREQERKFASERAFAHDFERTASEPDYEDLLDEYPRERLFRIVQGQRDNPEAFMAHARSMGILLEWERRIANGEDLTDDERGFTMVDILNVLKETQRRHFERLEEQRRKKTAAPQTATGAPATKAPVASRPTVNGTAERKAASLGNQLAATTAAGTTNPLKGISREEKVKRLGEKYG